MGIKATPLNSITAQPLVVPDNQRPYEWNNDLLEKFMSTLSEHVINAIFAEDIKKLSDVYFGAIILYKDDQNNPAEIVDGQQRILTFYFTSIVFEKIFT